MGPIGRVSYLNEISVTLISIVPSPFPAIVAELFLSPHLFRVTSNKERDQLASRALNITPKCLV